MNNIYQMISNYVCFNEQEEKDKLLILDFIKNNKDFLSRENQVAHFSVSAWIINKEKNKVLMAYHNIYKSFSWIGGHADNDERLLFVALKEIKEETGLEDVNLLLNDVFSIEVLPVSGHFKNNKYVSSHLHLNVTFLFEADENSSIRIKPDENSAIKWIIFDDLKEVVNEKWMYENIYTKLIKKAKIVNELNKKEKLINNFVGQEKISLVDYEGKIATTLFTAGCNFKCPYCHNKDLVFLNDNMKYIPLSEIDEYIFKRKGVIEAIVITGGEPTLMPSLIEKLLHFKKTGLKIKLDTNGSNPEVLEKILSLKLVDYVAMDIKTSLKNYTLFYKKVDNIKKSIELLENQKEVDYEFRTTLVKEFVSEDDIKEIALILPRNCKYYLQKYVDKENCVEHGFTEVTKEKALDYQNLLLNHNINTNLRGY